MEERGRVAGELERLIDGGTPHGSAVASQVPMPPPRNPRSAIHAKSPITKELGEADVGMEEVSVAIDGRQPPWLNGVELLEDAKWNKHVLPTGCKGIDILLGGGLREGQLTEIVGPSSSGKTQVCLRSALGVADMHLGVVLFLDTCNSFSPHRIAHMVNSQSDTLVKEGKEGRLKRIMSSILCHSLFDIFELLDVLHQLECKLKHQVKSSGNRIRLLIVDSISSLITPILGGKNSQGRLMMITTGILLKKIANEYNLSVLVTNHMVGGEGGSLKPALGESWKNIPHVRLSLSHDQGSNVCNVSILKHTIIVNIYYFFAFSSDTCNIAPTH
ncbi:DNA repair protein RAD51 homolog 4-like isoform X1 [Musa acuminata AAA Group]|uniref:DNA repair protein RAD51 homolog 4-like isoform X1 n=1 Tax=Musa acuminata AAA Group TaxID=214697 RepID=UPI0031D6324A